MHSQTARKRRNAPTTSTPLSLSTSLPSSLSTSRLTRPLPFSRILPPLLILFIFLLLRPRHSSPPPVLSLLPPTAQPLPPLPLPRPIPTLHFLLPNATLLLPLPPLQTPPPSLHHLSHLLNLPTISLPLSYTPLPLPLPPPTPYKHSKKLASLLGYSSLAKAPQHPHLALLIPATHPTPLLNTPAIEPYSWNSTLPSPIQCASQLNTPSHCTRLVEILLVTTLAACAPFTQGDLWAFSHSPPRIAQPPSCFQQGTHWLVTRDLLLSYLRSTCALPRGIWARIDGLRGVAHGVGDRAALVKQWLTVICKRRWAYYRLSS